MKKIFSLIFGVIFSLYAGYGQTHSKVDERFELTSIMFALAGVPEYCDCQIPAYWQDLLHEMKQYDQTEPIHFIRKLAQHHAIGYDAVSTATDMLEIRDGSIRLGEKWDITDLPKIDRRWTNELFKDFIRMTDEFYQLSEFKAFYSKHRPLYKMAEEQTNKLLDNSVISWGESFFGYKLNNTLEIFISLINGPHNYSLPSGILLGVNYDVQNETNTLSDHFMFTIVHEMAHHYTNPMVQRFWPQLQEAANKIYPYISAYMANQSYSGAYTTMQEGLNNLFTLMCLKEAGNSWYQAHLGTFMQRGFLWMERGIKFMDNFSDNRNLYPYIEDFMPQLIGFLNFTANHFDAVIAEHQNSYPTLVEVFPAIGSDITGYDRVILTFSEPMLGSVGFNGTGAEDPCVQPLYFSQTKWSDDHRQLTIELMTDMIRPGGLYGLQLRPDYFKSARYYNLNSNYINIIFHTQ